MEKKVVRLTESEFKSVVKESVKGVLSEIGYRGAALPHGANYNAMQSKLQNGDSNAVSKMDAANQARLRAITQSIHDSFPALKLHFIERDKANQFYSVEFSFREMKNLNDDRFVMGGSIAISGQKAKQGYIEFNYKRQSFYRVHFYGGGPVRKIYQLMSDDDYKDTFTSFLSFVISFGFSEEDNENNVDTHGPTLSKNK
jgi:hypothetical protein